jgi:hypothetical protein
MCTLHNTIWRIKIVRKSESPEVRKTGISKGRDRLLLKQIPTAPKKTYSRRLANEAI